MDRKLLAWGRAGVSRGRRPAIRDRLDPWIEIYSVARNPRLPLPEDSRDRTFPGDLNPRVASTRYIRRVPRLWLFTDSRRLPDPRPAAARLPRGMAGIVFRHDDHPDRAAIGRDLARICWARRLILIVAGDARLAAALRAGVHLRGGRWPGSSRINGFVTSSAHGVAELRRAGRAGAGLVFLSPAFATRSHPDAPALGAIRWSRLARQARPVILPPDDPPFGEEMPIAFPAPPAIAALGGIDGISVRRMPRSHCSAVGAIGALA